MKVAVIYNRDSQAVINLFGTPNLEKYSLITIGRIVEALEGGGHQVRAFEGDKNIISALEEFMPSVISGERPGLVFNLSYGIQGRTRYAHIPGILEMLGIPYLGSGPETHTIVLDKVLTKIVLLQKGLPTPRFTVLDNPLFVLPLAEELNYPLIVKPKGEAVSFGLKVVRNNEELREGVRVIYDKFNAPTLVEEYIEGREINVSLLGNDPVCAFPPVEIVINEGENIFTYEDKINMSGRNIVKVCPAQVDEKSRKHLEELALKAFQALGCYDGARVDFRLDRAGNPYILEVNSMPSLEPDGSYLVSALNAGYDYIRLINMLVDIAGCRYFGPTYANEDRDFCRMKPETGVFNCLTTNRDRIEEDLKYWTGLPSRTGDPVSLGALVKRLGGRLADLGLCQITTGTEKHSTWIWETAAGFAGGTLLTASIDVPHDGNSGYPIPYKKDPEWLYGEGIASSRAGITCILQALQALKAIGRLEEIPVGVFIHADEGRGMRYSSEAFRNAAAKAGRIIVLQPGFLNGKVVDQRRGSRRLSILLEGSYHRIGAQEEHPDIMNWLLRRVSEIEKMSSAEERLAVAVHEVQSERYSILLPHRIRITVFISFLDTRLADRAEKRLLELFSPDNADQQAIRVYIERLDERPPLIRCAKNREMLGRFEQLSAEWNLPFGLEASLIPSAAGEVPDHVPVVCGCGPASRDMFTPHECINRGELLQRTLLLALYLADILS